MARNPTFKGSLDDVMQVVNMPDFSAGLMSDYDVADLPANASPDCENVYFRPGRIRGRSGYVVRNASIPALADGAKFFYDSGGARRLVVWAYGNCYDMTDHSLTLVKTGAYTAGYRVCSAELNGILYFSDGETIVGGASGIRYYDPVTSTSDTPVLTSGGGSGVIATPACKAMAVYNGSLVLGNIKYVGGTYAKDAIQWSDVLDPTTIRGTNIFRVGSGAGGEINVVEPMGVSSVGISPFQALFIGKSEKGVFMLKGALAPDSLSETMIQTSVGCLDGYTAKFIPGPEGSGLVIWLATDRQLHWTNGVTSDILSEPISIELSQTIADRLTNGSTTRFAAFRDWNLYHYILDTGADSYGNNVHYVYDWKNKNFTRYKGWPSGCWAEAKDTNSQDVTYCVDDTNLSQVGVGVQDNATNITKYWYSGWIAAGDSEIWKIWKWIYAAFRTDEGTLTVTATCNMGQGLSSSLTLTPDTSSANAGDLIWDSGNWDEGSWAAGSGVTQTPYKVGKRLTVDTTNLDGSKGLLGGYDCQVKLSDASVNHFEVLGFKLLYLPRGRRRVA